MLTKALLYSSLFVGVLCQLYEDKRCRCVCPSPKEVLNMTSMPDPKLFIAYVPPNQCNCLGVILPRIGSQMEGREQEYCLRCECKYQTRNTAVIKVVVITIIWLLTLLLIYSFFLMCLDPFMGKRRVRRYKAQSAEESRQLIAASDEEI